jgi:hypothetical protein
MAIDQIGDGLEREDHDGTAWYAQPATLTIPPPVGTAALLVPMYDESIVAYQDLRVAPAHPPARPELNERAVVIDGYTVGSWKRTLTTRSTTVHAALFGPLSPAKSDALAVAVQRFGRFLALPAALTTGPVGGD